MKKLSEITPGSVFAIGEREYIKFYDVEEATVVVTKDILFNSAFGENNNLNESTVLEKLRLEVLPEIEKEVGAENVVEFETDLTTLDGLNPYPNLLSKISLPTFDFYRKFVSVFDKHKLNKWWWLATPDSAKSHGSDRWIVCVAPSGYFNGVRYFNYYVSGVRPILHFKSSILVSCE